jgi:hypothetical protein
MNKEIAHYKGRKILKDGKWYIIAKQTRNSSSRRYASLQATTEAIDHDRRIKITVPF